MLHLALAGPGGRLDIAFLEIDKLLLLAGADVNAVDDEGLTPLHVAASWNASVAVCVLREYAHHNLHWDAFTNYGKSAAQLAA